MELREIEAETEEQDEQADEMAAEIEDHKRQMGELEQAVAAMKEAQSAVDSEGLRGALNDAENAKFATQARIDLLRDQKEEMLQKNTEMLEHCRSAMDKKRQAVDKTRHLQQGVRSMRFAANVTSSFYDRMGTALQDDMDRSIFAESELLDVRKRLENLEL